MDFGRLTVALEQTVVPFEGQFTAPCKAYLDPYKRAEPEPVLVSDTAAALLISQVVQQVKFVVAPLGVEVEP